MVKLRIIKDDEVIVNRSEFESAKAAEKNLDSIDMKGLLHVVQRREETARIKARTDRWAMVATVILLLVMICIVGYQTYKENS